MHAFIMVIPFNTSGLGEHYYDLSKYICMLYMHVVSCNMSCPIHCSPNVSTPRFSVGVENAGEEECVYVFARGSGRGNAIIGLGRADCLSYRFKKKGANKYNSNHCGLLCTVRVSSLKI